MIYGSDIARLARMAETHREVLQLLVQAVSLMSGDHEAQEEAQRIVEKARALLERPGA